MGGELTISSLSKRAMATLQPAVGVGLGIAASKDKYDPVVNPGGVIHMGIAENTLMHKEVAEHITQHFQMTPKMLTYGEGPKGSLSMRAALTDFLNDTLQPHKPIKPEMVMMTSGAAGAIDCLSYVLCNEGDGILIGKPLYNGFNNDMEGRSDVHPIKVDFDDVNPTSVDTIPYYEAAIASSKESGIIPRAILVANPHNPLGRPYPRSTLLGLLHLCQKHSLHLISDEVYASHSFPSNDVSFPPPVPFTSILTFDLDSMGIDPSLVHVVYSMSKDFCANGLRLGAIVTPANPTLIDIMSAVGTFSWPSMMAEQAWTNLLTDQPFLTMYQHTFRDRMSSAYNYTTSVLKHHGVPYEPCYAGPYVWIDLSAFLPEQTFEAEMDLAWRFIHETKVWVAPGQVYDAMEPGHFRLTFASTEAELKLGLDRMIQVLTSC